MEITLLLDNDISGHGVFLEQGLKETGWSQLTHFQLKRLGDYGLPVDLPDDQVWRFVQKHRLLLITNNRNGEDEASLQATLGRENTLASLPVITVSDKDALVRSDYRQRVAHRIAEIVIYLENYLGSGRLYAP